MPNLWKGGPVKKIVQVSQCLPKHIKGCTFDLLFSHFVVDRPKMSPKCCVMSGSDVE